MLKSQAIVSETLLLGGLGLGLAIRGMSGLPLCSIKFDCGCGTGETLVCVKPVQNLLLPGLTLAILLRRTHRLCLRSSIFN